MDLTIMTDERRKIIDWLTKGISELKDERKSCIEKLCELEKIISEKQAIINELIGLPLTKE